MFYFPAENLPYRMVGPKITTTADGKGLLMSYGRSLYSFSCQSMSRCSWDTNQIELKISRSEHVMMRVPASMVENCECQDGYGGHTCESKYFLGSQFFLMPTGWCYFFHIFKLKRKIYCYTCNERDFFTLKCFANCNYFFFKFTNVKKIKTASRHQK